MFLICPRLSAGITTTMIQATATTPASVGVNQPVRMPPSRITGIISGSAASPAASITLRSGARALCMPEGPEEIAVDHQAEADHESRHHAGHEQPGDRDVADRAIDHGGDARRHQGLRWWRRMR